MTLNLKAIRAAAEAAIDKYGGYPVTDPATVIALLDRLEAAEKDAARYRWLRDSDWKQSTHPDVWTQVTNDYGELDVAVDVAMGEQK